MKTDLITEAEVAELERLSAELLAKLKACESKQLGDYGLRVGRIFSALEYYLNE